jgi:hypothetical protein
MRLSTDRELRSFERVNYVLRPSKQVERKLLIHAFQRLASGGFPLTNWTYVGMGSVYYADFILFHKYLHIDRMICVEAADIPRRMQFNLPFEFVELRMAAISEVIPTLDREQTYLVWLDYDWTLDEEVLRDVAGCLAVLAPGSALVVTVDADPEFRGRFEEEDVTPGQRREMIVRELDGQLGRFYPKAVQKAILAYAALPKFFARTLQSHIAEVISRRPGVTFCQLFNFRYADGAQMLSLGGIICDKRTRRQVGRSGVLGLPFVNRNPEPLQISVPPLTVRERLWLEQNVLRAFEDGALQFELPPAMLSNFKTYYRYYPTYYEAL